MKKKHALVTGATGFIGSNLIAHLLELDWKVDIIIRTNSDLDHLSTNRDKIAVHRYDGDIGTMRRIVRESRPDIVFHLASLFLSEHKPEDVTQLVVSNLLFGAHLVEAMSIEGVRKLINTGTSWQHYKNEDYNPVNLYAATKQAYEALLQYYVEARDLNVITLKLFDTYGPNDPRRKLIQLLLNSARTGLEISLTPGKQSIDMVHIHDVVRAYVRTAELLMVSTNQGGHLHYVVTSGQKITLKELVAELEQVSELRVPVIWGARSYRKREMMEPWSTGICVPGWSACIALSEGLKTII